MSIQNKPDYKIFASGAKSGEVETFPDILRGWGVTIDKTGEIPPMEWFNAIGKRTDEWLLYLTQRGIPEWDSSLDYPKSAVVTHGDVIYISLRASKGEQPNTAQAAWSKLSAFLGLGNYYTKSESDARFQPKGDYATNTALNNGLALKFDKTGGTITGDVTFSKNAIKSTKGTHTLPAKSGKLMQVGDYGVGEENLFYNINDKIPNITGFRTFDASLTGVIKENLMGMTLSWAAYGNGRAVRVIACEGGNAAYTNWYSLTYTNETTPSTQMFYTTGNTTKDHNGNLKVSGSSSELSDYPVGAPIPWPQSTAPVGYLVCNGQSFNKTTYPLLAEAYPAGVLPDLRGEFIRGLDAGRNVDSGRDVLSAQSDAIRNIKGSLKLGLLDKLTAEGAFKKTAYTESSGGGVDGFNKTSADFDASLVVPTANENRPRNIAFLYIVRAA